MNTPLVDRVRATVAATLNLPLSAIEDDTSAENNAAWDSLAQINLMLAIEQSFGIELDVEDFMSLTSVRGIAEHLAAQSIS